MTEDFAKSAREHVFISSADQFAADLSPPITIGFTNALPRALAAGGLRCMAERSDGNLYKVSMPVLWTVEPDDYVSVSVIVPGNVLKRVVALRSFTYLEMNGTVTAVSGDVEFPARFGLIATPRVVGES